MAVSWTNQAYNFPSALTTAVGSTNDTGAGIRQAAPIFKSFEMSYQVAQGNMQLSRAASVWSGSRVTYQGNKFGMAVNTGFSLPRMLAGNFVFAAIGSFIGDTLEFLNGGETANQAMAKFGADTLAYTGIGTAATAIGGMIGSVTFPLIGPIIGMAVGYLLGKLYETDFRPALSNAVETKIQSMGF